MLQFIIDKKSYSIMEKLTIQRKEQVTDPTIINIKKYCSLHSSFSRENCDSEQEFDMKGLSLKKTIHNISNKKKQFHRKRELTIKLNNDSNINDQVVQDGSNVTSIGDIKVKFANKENTMEKSRSLNQQYNLRHILSNYRSNNIKKYILNKLRRNSIFRVPVNYQPFELSNNQQDYWKGIQIQKTALNLSLFYNITYIFLACLITTLLIAFAEILYNQTFLNLFQTFCLFSLIAQIIMGFIRVKQVGSRKLIKIRQISLHYLKSTFIIDLLCLISMFICIMSSDIYVDYLLGIFFLKMPDCITNLQKIQTKLLESFYSEQYWCLMKILLTNFFYAHCIATILVIMSWLDSHQSWMHIKNIENAPWYQQYSWAYYWGTTIMLTVGFGDISAANYKQAICLVFIQTISCMALAYNINCIGNLLCDMKQNQLQKQKRLKVLKKLCDKNQVNSDLNFRVSNHIKQSYNTQKFNFQQQTYLIQKLPIKLKQQFNRQLHYKYLVNLDFIRNFTNRTILALAQKIQMKISHPDQIVIEACNNTKIVILRQGQIGLVPCYNYQKYHQIIIDKYQVKQGKPSVLISTNFLQLPLTRNYHLKSTVYSQIYQMDVETMLGILKNRDVDFQYYFSVKDKEKTQLNLFQSIQCPYCNKETHTKFQCPKLHYMPIAQQAIFKYLHKVKIAKNKRAFLQRVKVKQSSLLKYLQITQMFKKSKNQLISEQYLIFVTENQSIPSKKNFNSPSARSSSLFNPLRLQNQPKRNSKKQSINSINTKSFINATEIIQKQMRGILGSNQDFWNIQSDQLKDFKYYFSKQNPKFLENIKFKKASAKTKSKLFSHTKLKMPSVSRKNS